MITLIVLTLYFCYLLNKSDDLSLFNITIVAVFSGFVTELLCFILYVDSDYSTYKTETTNIYSLQGSSGVKGSFTFGTGTVESKPVYYFAFKVADKTYKISKIEGDVLFTLDNPQQPYIETKHAKLSRKDTDSIGYKYFVTDVLPSPTKVNYVVHLPETAIQQNYSAMPN